MTAPLTRTLPGVNMDRDGHTVALRGEIDLSTAGAVKSALTAAMADVGDATLVVDLRELTFMDSSGLHALCTLREEAVRRGNGLVLVRGPRQIHRVFELTATDGLFEFVDDAASVA
jgi:anti-anti-sigma factor